MEKDKNKLKAEKVLKNQGSIPLAILDDTTELNEKIDEVKESLKKPEVQKVKIEMDEEEKDETVAAFFNMLKGKKGDKGDKGDKGEQGEQGMAGKDGKDGLNGRDGTDGKNGMDGRDGIDGRDGTDGKNGSPDTPDQIADKLNTLKEVIDQSVIKGLTKKIADLSTNIAHNAVREGAKLYTGTSEARVRELVASLIATTTNTANTLAETSVNSTTTTTSLYQMTSAVDVEFKTSGGDTLMLLNEANRVVRFHAISGDASDGLLVESANGTDVALFGAGNGAGVTFYGGVNIEGITSMTPTALSGSQATSALSIAQTWNTSGTPTAFKVNITDTTSNAASLLLDLQRNSSSVFKVQKQGWTTITAGTLSGGSRALEVTGVMQGTIDAYGSVFNFTSSGTGTGNTALAVNLLAGYTGSQVTIAITGENRVAGTGNDLRVGNAITNVLGNVGMSFFAYGTTTGLNIGAKAEAANGNLNIGAYYKSISTKNSATNVGTFSIAANAGTTPIVVGGWFSLATTTPTWENAALVADNGSVAAPIQLWKDGGTTVLSVADGGHLTFGDQVNIVFNTTTGTKIGTATGQKIGFWNAAPIIQPTTGIAAATFTANTSGIADDTATFDGYTIGQVVKALRNTGLLA